MTEARQAPLVVPESEVSHCCPVLLLQSLSFSDAETHGWKQMETDGNIGVGADFRSALYFQLEHD